MSKKTANNNLVGRKVLIDYPVLWKGARPDYREQLRKECEATKPYFGYTGEIVAYDSQNEEQPLVVLLDGDRRMERFYMGHVTITSEAPKEANDAVVEALTSVRDTLRVVDEGGSYLLQAVRDLNVLVQGLNHVLENVNTTANYLLRK